MDILSEKLLLQIINRNLNISSYNSNREILFFDKNKTTTSSSKVLNTGYELYNVIFNKFETNFIDFVKIPEINDIIFFIKTFNYYSSVYENMNYTFLVYQLEPISLDNNEVNKKELANLRNFREKLENNFKTVKELYNNLKSSYLNFDNPLSFCSINFFEKEYDKNSFTFVSCITSELPKDITINEIFSFVKNNFNLTNEELNIDIKECETKEFFYYKQNFDQYYQNVLSDTEEEIEDEDEFYNECYDNYIEDFQGKRNFLNFRLIYLDDNAKAKLLRREFYNKGISRNTNTELNLNYLRGKILFSELLNNNFIIDKFVSVENQNYFNIFIEGLLFTDTVKMKNLIDKLNNKFPLLNLNAKKIDEEILELNDKLNNTIFYRDCSFYDFDDNEPKERIYKIIIPLTSVVFNHFKLYEINYQPQFISELKFKIRDINESSFIFGNKSIKRKLKEKSDNNVNLCLNSIEKISCKKDGIKRNTLILSDPENPNLRSRFTLNDVILYTYTDKISTIQGKKYVISSRNSNFLIKNNKINLKLLFKNKNNFISTNNYVKFKNSCKVFPKGFDKEKIFKVIHIENREYKNGLYSGKTKVSIMNSFGDITIIPITMVKKVNYEN